MKPIAFVVAACFVLAISLITTGARAQETDLSIRAPIGQELRYTYEARETSTTATPGETPRRTGAEHGLGIAVKVIRRDEQGGAAEVSLWWYSTAAISSTGRKFGFDSKNPKANEMSAPLEKELAPLLNRPVTVEFDAGGRVVSVTGAEALPRTQLTEKLTTELFSLDAMRRKIEPILGVSNQKPTAKLGEAWQATDRIPLTLRFAFDVKSRRRLDRISTDTAVVEDISEISIPAVDVDAPVIAVLEKGDGASTQVWNTAKGVLASYDAHHQMTISLTVRDTERGMAVELQETIRPAQ